MRVLARFQGASFTTKEGSGTITLPSGVRAGGASGGGELYFLHLGSAPAVRGRFQVSVLKKMPTFAIVVTLPTPIEI
ncbi:hypothetical protein [Accumulibacter sp.]|uniref:hypothetical protein n=1 Tax=Accumulibacter sp. TaxID=2053492 RepID=UPI0026164D25|nr:hypothetical protein [Accumulibacter sp.]